MKTIDLKCGKCNVVFPLQSDTYLARANQARHQNLRVGEIMLNQILCPNCFNEMPIDLREKLKALLEETELAGWEFGTNFVSKEQ